MQPSLHENLLAWLGWQSLYVSIAAAAVFFIVRLLQVRDPRILLGLWGLVLLRFFLPLDLAAPWSARNQFHDVATQWIGDRDTLRAQAQHGQRSAVQDVVTRVWIPAAPAPTPASGAPAPTVTSAAAPAFPWSTLLLCLWAAGVATFGAVALRQHLRLMQLLRRSELITAPHLLQRIDQWRTRLGIQRTVRLLKGDAVVSPFTFGLRHPVIYIPAALLDSLTPDECEAIIGHELAHVRGFDALWLVAERLVQITFFFHPVAWLATRHLDSARERCCDLRAVEAGNMNHSHYWQAVLAALHPSHAGTHAMALAPALGASGQSLKARILAMKQAQPMTQVKWLGAVGGMAVLALLVLPMARSQNAAPLAHVQKAKGVHPSAAAPQPQSAPAAQSVNVAAEPGPVSAHLPVEDVAPVAEISAPDAVDERLTEAEREGRQHIADAWQRVLEARTAVRRISTGDFANMIIVHDGKEVVCPSTRPVQDIKCTRTFNARDVQQLRAEADQELASAQQDLEEARRDAAQSVAEAQQEAREMAEDARREALEAREDARREAEQAKAEAEAARADAAEAARSALSEARRAQIQAYQRIAEARIDARQVEIEALQGTLEGLREAVRDMRSDHAESLAAAERTSRSHASARSSDIIANVISSLEESARQVEGQLAAARARR